MSEEKKDCCCGNEEQEHKHDGRGHDHDHGDCGCGHDHEHQMIHLTLDDGSDLNCFVLGTFEVEEKSYIALLPEDDEKVLLYQYEEVAEDEIELINIESEEEFEAVSKIFNEIFVSEEDEEEE